jgi:hypothetical protein
VIADVVAAGAFKVLYAEAAVRVVGWRLCGWGRWHLPPRGQAV